MTGAGPARDAPAAGALPGAGPWRAGRGLLALLALLTALRLAFLASGILDLSPDEAHYWEWSRRLDLSYYSKGPLVAYLIRGVTELVGSTAFGVRLGAIGLSLLGAWALYRLGHLAYGAPGPGLVAVAGLQLTPLVWAGSVLMTIDPPFLALWVIALACLHRALRGGGSPWAWIAAGAAVGLGLLAKYTMVFVGPGLLLYLWRAPEARRTLRSAGVWLGALLAGVLFSPVVIWNLRQGWVSARHVASQGEGAGLTAMHLPELVGSQLAVLTPLVGALLAWGAWQGVREGLWRGREPDRFLAAFALPILAFYALVALQGKVQANWPAAAYPPLALLTAGALLRRAAGRGPRTRRRVALLGGAALALATAGSALVHATDLLGVPPRLDPTTRLKGWGELGAAVAATRAAMPAPARTFVAAPSYQVTSELAFYVPGHPPAYNLNLGRRMNQYDLWEGPESRRGWDAVYVEEGARPLDPRVREAFGRVDGPWLVEIRRGGRVVRTFTLYRGWDFRQAPPPAGPVRY